MKALLLPILVLSSYATGGDLPGNFSGEIQAQYRYFHEEGEYGNTQQNHVSLVLQPEYSHSWNNDRSVITVEPFIRIDSVDDERSHADIRELSFISSWSNLELRAGISKVFWGVTESQHLVDVINQTDFVENPDGEQKLGQPMINTTLVTDTGNYDFFILPYFRESTFPGETGRYRTALPIDTNRAEFTNDKKNRHIDYAFRWSSYWQNLDWAVSYFTGTDRDPGFRFDADTNTLIPIYGQTDQLGLELQFIYKDLLSKAEIINKDSEFFNTYIASTIGFEYTFYNVANRLDLGALYEWLYDDRGEATPSGMQNASFIGTRIAMNDEASSEILMGTILDNDTSDMILFRIEASRRISPDMSLDLEVNIIGSPPVTSILNQFKSDDYLQLTLSFYF